MPKIQIELDSRGLKTGSAQASRTLSSLTTAIDRLKQSSASIDSASISAIAKNANLSEASVRKLVTAMQQAERTDAFRSLQASTGMTQRQLSSLLGEMGSVNSGMQDLSTSAANAKIAIGAAGAAIAVVGKSCLDATLEIDRLNKAYGAVMKTDEAASKQLSFVYEVSQRLGLQYQATAEAAKGFFASSVGSPLQKDMNDIFESVASSGAALSLSTDQMSGVFLALSQIASKGKLSMEEVHQIAERMPGTFQAIAKALNVTQAELSDTIASGKIMAADVLPALAKAWKDQYGKAAIEAADGVQGALNRLSSEWGLLKASIIDSDAAAKAIRTIGDAASSIRELPSFAEDYLQEIAVLGSLALAIKGVSTARKAAAAVSETSLASSVREQGAYQTLIDRVTSYDTALKQRIASERAAANASLEAANADATRLEREKMLLLSQTKHVEALASRLAGTQQQARAEAVLASTRERLARVDTQLADAENRAAVAAGNLSRNITGMQALRSVGMQVVDFLGGPLGIALTAASAGLAYFITRQDESAKAAEKHLQAQVELSGGVKGTTKAIEEQGRALTELEKINFATKQKKQMEEYKEQAEKVADALNNIYLQYEDLASNPFVAGMGNELPLKEQYEQLKSIIDAFADGSITAKQLKEALEELRAKTAEAHGENHSFVRSLDDLLNSEGGVVSALANMAGKMFGLGDAAASTAAKVQAAKAVMASPWAINTQGAQAQIEELEKGIRNAQAEMAGLKDASGLVKLLPKVDVKTISGALSAYKSSGLEGFISTLGDSFHKLNGEQQKNLILMVDSTAKSQDAMKQLEAYRKSQKESSGSGAESAAESIARLRQEISVLNGEATKSGNTLAQRIADIEKMGKKAGLSAGEIASLKEEYQSAFKKSTIDEFNKQILKLSGNTQALRAIEIDETVKSWEQRFAAAGLSAAEAAPKIEQIKQALSLEQSYKDLQTVADFYEKLGEMSGEYGKDIEYQNKLIEKQARAWEQAGVPLSDIAEMVELMQLDMSVDPFDGAYRGLLRFSSEFGDSAKQWESITYGFASDFNDATRDMFDEFLDTGKVSFSSLRRSFDQLLRDMAYQAIVQPIVVSVVGGVQQGLYGMTTAAGIGGAGGAGSLGLGALTNLPITSLLPESVTSGASGLLGSITGGINSLGSSILPGVFAPSSSIANVNAITSAIPGIGGIGGTTTLMATLGAAGTGFGLGSLGGGLLAGLVGLNSGGGSLGGGIGGALGAGIGSIVPGIGTALGGILGGALGSIVGGLFGGKKKDPPELYAGYNLSLSKGTSYVYASPADNLSPVVAQQYQDYLDSIAKQALELSSGVQTSLSSINQGLSDSYTQALSQLDDIKFSVMWEGEYIKESTMEAFGEGITQKVQKQLYEALTGMDLTPLAMAAAVAVADSADELRTAISGAISFIGLGANLGDYQDDFEAEIGDKILAALNTMDTSGLRLNIDKTSLQGWQTAVAALDAWDSINATIKEIIDPTAELDAQLQTANTQFDGWIAQLRELGWQESAIAEVEAKRSVYLQQYADAVRKATQQDLSLRMIALQSGSDSWAYSSASLAVQQENELAELAKKFGTESDIYKQAQAVQQAEAAQNRLTYLQGLLEEARQEELERMEDAASEADNLAKSFDGLADTIESTRKSYWGDDSLNLMGTAFDDLRKQFDETYARAMAGDEEALAELPGLSQSLLEQGKQSLSNEAEYTDLFYDVDQKLKRAHEYAESQVDIQQGIYDSIQLQIQNMQQSLATQQGTKLTTDQILAEMGTLKTTIAEALEKAASYSGGRLDSASGIYKSHYATSNDLLQAKADAMNRGQTLAPGQTAGGWTAAKVLQQIKDDNLTIQSWYDRFGKAEGFASGGLTPRNTPFWVGENGPELMMSPHQYGVLSNPDSVALVSSYRGGYDSSAVVSEIRTQGQQSYNVLRQILSKTNDLASQNSRILRTINMWQAEGLPQAATR